MKLQLPLIWSPEQLTKLKSRDGVASCECGKPYPARFKAFAKTMDSRLSGYVMDIGRFCRERKSDYFRVKDVFNQHNAIADVQKLGYFGIIERKKKSTGWTTTYMGWRFLRNEVAVPRRIWVFAGRVIDETEDDMVRISEVSPRYQKEKMDFAIDYRKVKVGNDLQPKLV